MTKIIRSFSYKLNTGNYTTRDFFCSQEVDCEEENKTQVSEAVYQWCKEEVIKSVNSYLKELAEAKKAEEIKEKTQEVIESVKEEINIPIINQ